MNFQEENWLNLFGYCTEEGTTWHALTTVYSPELEVMRTYKFTRKFTSNADRSIIAHQNTYYLPDGTVNEKSWTIEKQSCNLSDGVCHPEGQKMRAIGFGNQTSIWVSKNIDDESNLGSEVFLKHDNWRYGLLTIYKNGNLDRFVIIKENTQNFPDTVAENTITNLEGKWHLERTKVQPNLEYFTETFSHQEIDINSSVAINTNFFLPEKVLINLPKVVPIDQAFEITVGQQTGENLYRQIKIQYDSTGQLSGLISEVYTLEN